MKFKASCEEITRKFEQYSEVTRNTTMSNSSIDPEAGGWPT